MSDTEPDPLVLRAQEGETSAYSQLYELYAPRLFASCSAMLGNRHDAEDIVQLTFTHAFRRLSGFQHRSKFLTWLYGIALRLIANHRRRQAIRQRFRGVFGGASARRPTGGALERHASARQDLGRLALELSRLTPVKREAFVLYYLEGMKIRDVAEITGTSVQNAFARAKAARAELLASVWPTPPGEDAP